MLLGRAGELTAAAVPRFHPVMIVMLLCVVVLEGEMLPEIFAVIFRKFVVRRTLVESRVDKKFSCSWDFPVFVFVTYCFRYYFALSSLLIVFFFNSPPPWKTSFFADIRRIDF